MYKSLKSFKIEFLYLALSLMLRMFFELHLIFENVYRITLYNFNSKSNNSSFRFVLWIELVVVLFKT